MLKLQKLSRTSALWLILIQWVIALMWLKSAIKKFTEPHFMQNIGETVNAMVSNTSFEFYGDIMDSVEATVWGNLTRYSELVVGLVILLAGWHLIKTGKHSRRVITMLTVALFYGAFMNLNFYLAAGWDSQAVVGINMVMGLVQIILGTHYLLVIKKK